MSTGFLALLRQCRRPFIAVALALVLVQTVVAGLATAQVAAVLEPFEGAVICHGAGGSAPDPAQPDSGKVWDRCCAFCAATAPALLPVAPPVAGRIERAHDSGQPLSFRNIVSIDRRAVRAGPSQAPPSLG
jgi:hypothetical protein